MTSGDDHRGAGDEIAFHHSTFHGSVQGKGVQNIHNYYGVQQGRKWWQRRTTAMVAALVVLVSAGGAYVFHLTGGSHLGRGTPNGTPVPGVMNTGNATIPSSLQINAELLCRGVYYWPKTKAWFLKKFHESEYTGKSIGGAAQVGGAVIDITNQTSSRESVLLTGMRVLVLQRKPPPTSGIIVNSGGCGSGITARPFWTDLNKPNSPIIAEAVQGYPPVTFPFKISPNDPEVFRLSLKDTTCDCRIAVEIDWVSGGKAGKTILNNGGPGFWIVAAPKVPTYELGSSCSTANSACQLVPARYKETVSSPPRLGQG